MNNTNAVSGLVGFPDIRKAEINIYDRNKSQKYRNTIKKLLQLAVERVSNVSIAVSLTDAFLEKPGLLRGT